MKRYEMRWHGESFMDEDDNGEWVRYDAVTKIRSMIKEWRKGCSCASDEQPERCVICTLILIESIEKRLA
jgi:hypothetical protein